MPSFELAWEPTAAYVERANVTRLMRRHGIDSIAALRQRSVEEPEWFWDAVVEDLGIRFDKPYSAVRDLGDGAPWARWFVDGEINLAVACVDRWADDPATADRIALICEAESEAVEELTFAQLKARTDQVAAAMRAAGVGKGDAVAIFMPMVAEAAIAFYAIAKIGAVCVPIFSGFAASAVAARLQDADVKLLFTADGSLRRGRVIPLEQVAAEAVAAAPTIERLVVVDHLDPGAERVAAKSVSWREFVADHAGAEVEAEPTTSEDRLMIAYTSGTSGRPKGAVHVHGGFLVKIASEAAYQTDVHADDVLFWFTDMGWIMGAWALVGAHGNGAASVLYDGLPDHPDKGRLWSIIERHRVTVLGVSPTLIRALRSQGHDEPSRHDLSSLRILGSAGEPWNEDPYDWYLQSVGGRCPVINFSGGTEVGACFLSNYPVESIEACSLGGPSLGMDMEVFDEQGRPLRNEVGELVCRQPWPSMTRGVWGDQERYIETYWSTYPGVWRHGDWALISPGGQWYLLGRSDDTINVAGKRLGPAEIESVLASHDAVRDVAAIGMPDETKGEVVWCFVVADSDGAELVEELRTLVADELGRPFKPGRVILVEALPKTASGKVVRRAVRAVACGDSPGDLSTMENPQALDGLRDALALPASGG
jgi:acetyl-CoA synthetase